MNKWLNKLFKGDEKQPPTPVASSFAEPAHVRAKPKSLHQLHYGLQRTLPDNQWQNNQPIEILKKFIPLKSIAEDNFTDISHKTAHFKAGNVIFLQGELADAVYYLLSGAVDLHPDTDDHFDLSIAAPKLPTTTHEVIAETTQATLPLNYGKLFGATAVAKTDVDIVMVANDLLPLWSKQSQANASFIDLMDIKLPPELTGNNHFFISFTQAFQKNKLQLPSLPDVAIKLMNAMQGDISIREAVDIIQMDPAIVTKLIQVANSSLYAPVTPIKNSQNAVARLGLTATRNLVMSINVKQLFQCKNRDMFKLMQKIWRQSLLVSSLSFVLAEEIGVANPEEALLGGLVSDIGIIPLLHFVERLRPEEKPDLDTIIKILPYVRAPLGKLVLNTLGFADEFSHIPYNAENWFYDSGESAQLIDVVILAKLHSYLGTERAKELPLINTIPAYSKLENGKLNPDLSLSVLHKAQKRIHDAMSMLA